jgi:uncharacterized membrane-anchored protein
VKRVMYALLVVALVVGFLWLALKTGNETLWEDFRPEMLRRESPN